MPLTCTSAPSGEELTASDPLKPDAGVELGASDGCRSGTFEAARVGPTAARRTVPAVLGARGAIATRGRGGDCATTCALRAATGLSGASVAAPASAATGAAAAATDFAGSRARDNVPTAATATEQTSTASTNRRTGNSCPLTAPCRAGEIGGASAISHGKGTFAESVASLCPSCCSGKNARSATSVAFARAILSRGVGLLLDWHSSGNACRQTASSCSCEAGRVGEATTTFDSHHNACRAVDANSHPPRPACLLS